MKKFWITLICCCAAVAVYADKDLRVQKFSGAAGGSAEVVSTGWKNYGLKLTAGKDSDVRVVYKQLFTFQPGMVYEVSADVTGSGEPFVELRLLDIHNRQLAQIPMQVKIEDGDELEAKLDLRKVKLEVTPNRFQVVIGVKKGASLLFEDIELDIDND